MRDKDAELNGVSWKHFPASERCFRRYHKSLPRISCHLDAGFCMRAGKLSAGL